MQDVSRNKHLAPGQFREHLLQGKGVKKSLRRVSVRSIPGIDHRGPCLAGDGLGQSGHLVSHHDVVSPHRLQGIDRILYRFPLRHRGMGHIELNDICREPLGGHLERGQGPGARLIEQHEHRFPLEGGDFLHRTGEEFLERSGLIQQKVDLLST